MSWNTLEISTINLSNKQQKWFNRMSSFLRRAAIEHLENFNDINEDIFSSFDLSDEARSGKYQPILQREKHIFRKKEKNLYKELNNYKKADAYFWISNRIFKSNISNKWNLSDEKQMEDLLSAQKEMSVANAIIDNLRSKKINQKKGS